MSGENFVELIPDYQVMVDYGLRIVRDESYSIARDPKHIDIREVSNLLVGLNIALCSIPVTVETVPIRDFIIQMIDEKFKPAIRKLDQEEWGGDEDDYED